MYAFCKILVGLVFFNPVVTDEPDLKGLSTKIDRGTPEQRIKAIEQAGELGPKAKGLLRSIVNAMLTRERKVRDAAVVAMKKIDEHVGNLALKLLLNFDDVDFDGLLKEGTEVIEPLLPILFYRYELLTGSAQPGDYNLARAQKLLDCMYTWTPEDPDCNKIMLKALKSSHIKLQHTGVMAARTMKQGKQGLKDVLRIAKFCPNEGIRAEAVYTAAKLADGSTKASVLKALGEMRLDRSEIVRKAVDDALEKVNAK
jgi:hypothetical protein